MKLFDKLDDEITISVIKVSEYPEFRKELISQEKNVDAYNELMVKLTKKLNYCPIK